MAIVVGIAAAWVGSVSRVAGTIGGVGVVIAVVVALFSLNSAAGFDERAARKKRFRFVDEARGVRASVDRDGKGPWIGSGERRVELDVTPSPSWALVAPSAENLQSIADLYNGPASAAFRMRDREAYVVLAILRSIARGELTAKRVETRAWLRRGSTDRSSRESVEIIGAGVAKDGALPIERAITAAASKILAAGSGTCSPMFVLDEIARDPARPLRSGVAAATVLMNDADGGAIDGTALDDEAARDRALVRAIGAAIVDRFEDD